MVCFVLIGLLLCCNWPLGSPLSCPSGRFGLTDCKYICHCKAASCDDHGQCPDNRCANGWFGPACQYVDLSVWARGPTWVIDSDDSTCNPDQGITSVSLQLDQADFTWMWLTVDRPDWLHQIQVEFSQSMACANMRSYAVNLTTLEVHCSVLLPVSLVTLMGSGVRGLCSVYISGGRNLAAGETGQGRNDPRAVDGDVSTCQVCQPPVSRWEIVFTHLANISTYRVLSNHKRPENSQLMIYSEDDQLLYKGNLTNENTTLRHRSALPVKRLVVQEGTGSCLMLCEMLFYGETVCPAGQYGKDCEHQCDCEDRRCYVSSGHCLTDCAGNDSDYACAQNSWGAQMKIARSSDGEVNRLQRCPAGRYGPGCNRNCTGVCGGGQSCKASDGTCPDGCAGGYFGPFCDMECEVGTYGDNCLSLCSEHCTNKSCDPVKGTCLYGCLDEYLPPLCDSKYANVCSRHCTGQICFEDGTCNSTCQPGYQPPFCTLKCGSDRYGADCQHQCSPYCKDTLCEHINGTCIHGCLGGYLAPLCMELVRDHVTYRDEVFIIGILLFLIILVGISIATVISLSIPNQGFLPSQASIDHSDHIAMPTGMHSSVVKEADENNGGTGTSVDTVIA